MEAGSFAYVLARGGMLLVPMLLSLTLHEYAHAWAAKRLGDDTAERAGRLTMNPLAHGDFIGTLFLPLVIVAINIASGPVLPCIGWARPAPCNPGQFTRKLSVRSGMLLFAAAGPLVHLLLAIGCDGVLSLASHGGVLSQVPVCVSTFAKTMVDVNVALFVFNMIPVYPLDGQRLLSGLLSPHAALHFERFNYRFGWVILMAVVFFGCQLLVTPVRLVQQGLSTVLGLG